MNWKHPTDRQLLLLYALTENQWTPHAIYLNPRELEALEKRGVAVRTQHANELEQVQLTDDGRSYVEKRLLRNQRERRLAPVDAEW